jgi:uncharacterized protein YjbI with pentapeptide repeats
MLNLSRTEASHGLRADCVRCFALCCVAPIFTASADFAINKAAGRPCPNLQSNFRCGIHARLRQRGFPGCTVYDCFGAGQKVSQVTFGGQDWRRAPRTAKQMFEVFSIMRQLHELLWYLTEALTRPPARPLHGELRLALDQTERLAHDSPDSLVGLDVAAHRQDVNALLLRTSELVRAEFRRQKKDRRFDLLAGNPDANRARILFEAHQPGAGADRVRAEPVVHCGQQQHLQLPAVHGSTAATGSPPRSRAAQ